MKPRQITTHGWCVKDDLRADRIATERKVAEEDDVMAHTWCCLTCSSQFRFGEIKLRLGLHCPRCDGEDLHPAGDEVVELQGYEGPIGILS